MVAADLVRELESANQRRRLEAVVQSRSRLNPSVRKQLILALSNAGRDITAFGDQLSADFQEPVLNGKAYQRVIREYMAEQPEPDIEEKRTLAADLKHAIVREISYAQAKQLVYAFEWLGNLGTTEWAWGLFAGEHLAGVVCFGSTAGTKVAASVCGEEHKHKVATITRGCAAHWAHPHSASFLISAACKEMTKKGYHIFVSYADPAPGSNEVGTIYSALNHHYCGTTSPVEQFKSPDGKVHDSRQVSGLARDRRGGTLKYKRTRAAQKQLLIEQGCEFFEGTPKHRYVGIYGDRRTKRLLRSALRWDVLPYPKRQVPNAEVKAMAAGAGEV